MDTETAINFLVEHAAKVDTRLDGISHELNGMATKKDIADLKEEIRNGTKAMRHYTAYVENILNTVTKGQLSLEEQVTSMRVQMETIEQRLSEIEKRNPPQAA
jgi:hypothetical protein